MSAACTAVLAYIAVFSAYRVTSQLSQSDLSYDRQEYDQRLVDEQQDSMGISAASISLMKAKPYTFTMADGV